MIHMKYQALLSKKMNKYLNQKFVVCCSCEANFRLFIPFVICSPHLLMFLGSLYGKQYGPGSDCLQWSSLIRVDSVCFHDEILSEFNFNICSRDNKQTTFSGQKILVGQGLIF